MQRLVGEALGLVEVGIDERAARFVHEDGPQVFLAPELVGDDPLGGDRSVEPGPITEFGVAVDRPGVGEELESAIPSGAREPEDLVAP